MKVMNIGIIIRNDHDDTFPVALTPQMVGVIQNLLTQIPLMKSKLVDGQGNKIAAKASIPIIPRAVDFDWDKAYQPLQPKEEAEMMKQLQEKYSKVEGSGIEGGGSIITEGIVKEDDTEEGKSEDDPDNKVTKLNDKPALFTDKDNPFNMTLAAKGRANVDLKEPAEVDAGIDKGTNDEKYPDVLADKEKAEGEEEVKKMEDGIEKAAEGESKDVTVTPETLDIGVDNKL